MKKVFFLLGALLIVTGLNYLFKIPYLKGAYIVFLCISLYFVVSGIEKYAEKILKILLEIRDALFYLIKLSKDKSNE